MGASKRQRAEKGTGTIYYREDRKKYFGQITIPGDGLTKARRVSRSGDTRSEVRRKLNQALSDATQQKRHDSGKGTLGEYMTTWLEEDAYTGRAPSTVKAYNLAFRAFIGPELGHIPLEGLTARDVTKFGQKITSTPKDPALRGQKRAPQGTELLSPAYARNTIHALSAALQDAASQGIIPANPVRSARLPTGEQKLMGSLTVAQVKKLLHHIDETKDPQRALWYTLIYTGARRMEVLGLQVESVGENITFDWQLEDLKDEEIDKKESSWEVRPAHGQLRLTRPKWKSGRGSEYRETVLVEPLKSVLKDHIGDRTTGFVFTRHGRPIQPKRFRKDWDALLEAAGVPQVPPHGARHALIDLLVEAGVSMDIITEIVGHAATEVTQRYRTRINETGQRSAYELLQQHIAGTL